MNTVDIVTDDIDPPSWTDALQSFCIRVLERLEYADWEVSVLLCTDRVIRDLNRRYRDKDEPTDVLSFPQGPVDPEQSGMLFPAGDIVISVESLTRNAEEFQVPEEEELKRLVIHGILHLAGFDHKTNEEYEGMLQYQETLLQELTEERLF